MKIKNQIFGILSTRTVKQSGIAIAGTVTSGILGALFYVYLARKLGRADFGVFSVATTFIALVASVSNVGTDTGLIRFVGKYFSKDRVRALKFMKLGLVVKAVIWFIVFILGYILIPLLANIFFKKPGLTNILRASLIGVGGALLFSYSAAIIQAVQRYTVWSFFLIFDNILRLLVVGVLAATGFLGLYSGLWVFMLIPLFGFLLTLFYIPNFWGEKINREVEKEFFKYNKWVALFTIFTAISSRLDTFLTARFLTLEEVGVYAVAVTLSSFVSQITLGIATVVAPKMAGFDNKQEAKAYFIKLQLFVLVLAFFGIISGTTLGYLIIQRVFGVNYVDSFYPFAILLLAQAMFFLAIPTHSSIMYFFSFPKLFFWLSLGFLIIVAGFGWTLIPKYGIIGASITMLLAQIYNFLIPAVWVLRKFKR